jgi:hypothetical protein
MKPITTTVAGRVTVPVRETLEAKAATRGISLSALISQTLTNLAKRWEREDAR